MKRNKNEEKQDLRNSVKKHDKSRTKAWVYLYIASLTIIMITKVMPIIADIYIDSVINDMDDEYTYHLRFSEDGYQSHYYVERWNTSAYGIIDLTYYTPTHTLEVEIANIKVLGIDSRSMFEAECLKVTGRSPYDDPALYKKYFIERDLFTVNIITLDNRPITNLSFKDIPIAYEVRVNGETWLEGDGYYYTPDYGMVIGNVPSGTTNVEIWFKSPEETGPTAIVDNEITAEVDEIIIFDASFSHDDEGIEYYYWDFGDGNFSVENTPITTFSYPEEGEYIVVLTVRDTDSLIERAYINVTVIPISENNPPIILDVVPNQEKYEDCPPWNLDLSWYGSDLEDSDDELKWYITGENTSLYTVAGENITNNLTFIPVPRVHGNDEVILWLEDSRGARVSQVLWINIASINNPPYFNPFPPNLFVHYDDPGTDYDDPYPWNYTFYVHDVDTPLEELSITTSEPTADSGDGYADVNGLEVTFHYPKNRLNESILVILTLSDGIDSTQTAILVTVTSNWVPELINNMPDVILEENSTLYNVFDLDDYFSDRDNDSLFFSSGYFHLEVDIDEDNTVDITALGHWTGEEYVTFRAEDPIGAISEDTITVTVIPVNDPPVISGVPDLFVHYDYSYAFDLSPYISDLDNPLSDLVVWTSELTDNIRLQQSNNLGIIILYPESMNGMTIPTTIYVSDGMWTASQQINITVTNNFPPKLGYYLPDVFFDEDTILNGAFTLSDYFFDIDDNVLFYTNGSKFINITINEDLSVDFSAPENWYGSEFITFRATDPKGALAEDKILVIVVPVNDPPNLREIPGQEKDEGGEWILDLSQYIEDVDNELSELTITVENEAGQSYVNLVGNILIFNYPNGIRKDSITISVSDGELETQRSFTVDIQKPVQTAPSIWDLIPWPWVISIIVMAIGGAFAIYKKKSKYQVYDAFCIHQMGLPIAHISRQDSSDLEDIVVSGMFTAVQEFINNVFTGKIEGDWEIDEMKFGEHKILIEKNPYLFLAVIFEGYGPKLRKRVKKLIQDIDEEYGSVLENWDGVISKIIGVRAMTMSLLSKKACKKVGTETKIKAPSMEFEDETKIPIEDESQESNAIIEENQAEEVEEEIEILECPVCGKEVSPKETECPRCGIDFV